jgi:hypothetical protein
MTEGLPDWFVGKAAAQSGMGQHVYTTQRHPLFYLQINKCGCTYLRNLLFHLDHGQMHPFSKRIHSYEAEFIKAGAIPNQVLVASHHVFCAVRDPVDRFLSLYFDKLSDPNSPRDVWMRKLFLKEAGLQQDDNLGLEAYRENCLKALDWTNLNLAGKTGANTNPHWQRQSVVLDRIRDTNPHLLNLDDLSRQLPQILRHLIPDIADQMGKITERNESRKPFKREEIVDDALASAIHAVYPQDTKLINDVRANWASVDYAKD